VEAWLMTTKYPDIGSHWCDDHGHVVMILDHDIEDQKVVYQRPGYEWKCATPLIVFRARFRRTDK
jgi:hypothetical protein